MPEKPLPPPSKDVFEAPLVCIRINRSWIPYLIGVIRPMRYPEYWTGTLEENRKARYNATELMYQLAFEVECEGMTDCCVQVYVITRINVETGRWERSIDNGQTWQPSPDDPVTAIIQQPPPVTAGRMADKCAAATQGKAHLEDWIARTSEGFNTAVSIVEFGAVVIGIIADLILIYLGAAALTAWSNSVLTSMAAAMVAAWNAGKAAFDAYWTPEVTDEILCALVCTIGDDGAFTEAQFADFINRMKTDLPGNIARDFMIAFLYSVGAPGLNNMCSYGTEPSADCSDCQCEGCDFTGWEVVTGTLVSQDTVSIVADTFDGGDGKHYVTFRNPNVNNCCCELQATTIPNLTAISIGVVPCGLENDTQEFIDFSYTGELGNYWAASFAQSCRVTLTGQPPENCA